MKRGSIDIRMVWHYQAVVRYPIQWHPGRDSILDGSWMTEEQPRIENAACFPAKAAQNLYFFVGILSSPPMLELTIYRCALARRRTIISIDCFPFGPGLVPWKLDSQYLETLASAKLTKGCSPCLPVSCTEPKNQR